MRLSAIAAQLGCQLSGDGGVEIQRISGIENAGPGDLTFVANRKYLRHLKTTQASAIILGYDMPEASIPTLRSANPYLTFSVAIELFYQAPVPDAGVHPTAVIAPDVLLGEGVRIGPYVVIGRNCAVGSGAILHPHVVLYPGVKLGEGVVLHAHVVVREFCELGNRVIAQNGAIVGSDGFGFAPRGNGTYHKILQSGRVILEDDVEIGANTTIDRAAVGDTIIRRGAKLDNLVQVGHGSTVGENNVIAAQAGLAGSSHLGKDVKLGGQVGIAGHLRIGDAAVVTAQSGTSHDVLPGAVVSGSPAFESATWRRSVAAFEKLPELVRRVRALEERLRR